MIRNGAAGNWAITYTIQYYSGWGILGGLIERWEEASTSGSLSFNIDSNTNEVGYSVGSGNTPNYVFQLFEVHNEIATISPEDADNALVPADGTDKVNVPLSADQYVLWPQQTTVGGATTTTTTYSLIHVGKLGYQKTDGEEGKGTWRYEDSSYLHEYPDSLKYMFSLTEGAKFGSVYGNTLGGDYDGGQGFVKAPLGTDGSQTFIPMGCISFKVNKNPTEGDPIKIRVIVAVPTSDVVNGLSYDEDYYFGLWKNSVASGQNQTFNFEKGGAIEMFELPRSQPLFNGQEDSASDTYGEANPVRIQYDANGNAQIDSDEQTYYNTYFQGEIVLVAYEFTVTEAGVYTLGATNGPMQIVYFSADGVASLGRDGTGGAYLQGIDFVYDTVDYSSANKIVTVTMIPNTTDPNAPNYVNPDQEDYNYYYESSCIMHFDNDVQNQNDFVNIYHEEIYLRRYYKAPSQAEGTTAPVQRTVLSFTVKNSSEVSQLESNRYVKCEPYAVKSDEVITTYYVTINGTKTLVIDHKSSRAK